MPTNAQVIGDGLLRFDEFEDEVKASIASFIECPSESDCAWDGKTEHLDVCTECKIRWLQKEWDW